MKYEMLYPTDIVSMVVELMPRLDLVELQKLILFSEMEIDYREEKGILDD
jgi:hypothetical protein